MSKVIRTVEQLKKKYPTAKFIKNWKELRDVPNESDTHILEIGEYSGWLKAKHREKYKCAKARNKHKYEDYYLSTHTFYGQQFVTSTKKLQKCGFDVVLDNWDKEVEEVISVDGNHDKRLESVEKQQSEVSAKEYYDENYSFEKGV
jgi:hypothetical protein